MKSTICIAEDRKICEPALKLLLLSLTRHSPEIEVSLFYPAADTEFLSWVKRCPQVSSQSQRLNNDYGWNIKPQAILHLLNRGYEEVIWFDSDILVQSDVAPIFSQLKADLLVATEDALGEERDDRDSLRARLWGFPVGRVFPFVLNTGVLRATRSHQHLMERWWEQLQLPIYQDSQRTAWHRRSPHMRGDQDVLTALLASNEFAAVPIHILRRGKDILQFNGVYGYSVAERMRHVFIGGPTFVHSFGGKPWSERWRLESSNGLTEYIKKVYLDLSPYTVSARQYRQELDCDVEWMEPHYTLSAILRVLGMEYPPIVGFPIAVFSDLARLAKQIGRAIMSNESLPQQT